MPSTILRKVFGENSVFGQRSLYDALEDQDRDEEEVLRDLEEQAGMISGDYNEHFGTAQSPYEAYRDDPTTNTGGPLHGGIRLEDRTASGSRQPQGALMNSTYQSFLQESRRPGRGPQASRGPAFFGHRQASVEADEVPASLLLENGPERDGYARDRYNATAGLGGFDTRNNVPGPGIPTYTARDTKSDMAKEEEARRVRLSLVDPKERIMWKWANVSNLDNFLLDVYNYWNENGIYSIVLARVLNLTTMAFTVLLTTWMSICVDHKKLQHAKHLDEIVIPHCFRKMSNKVTVMLFFFSLFWVFRAFQLLADLFKLWEMHNFFKYLLDLKEDELQSVAWQKVVERLMALRDQNPVTSNALKRKHSKTQSKQRMDAHDIANRLMRKENYLIALFNKDILDLTVPFPFFRNQGNYLTKTLEWNLWLCINDFAFSPSGQLRPAFLKEADRKKLSEGLRRRFKIIGCINIATAPIVAAYTFVTYFLRYFSEFKMNPAALGQRQYTPLAEWLFREFNELPHLFANRVRTSYPFALRYVDQFPKDRTIQLASFMSFITGSLLALLVLPSFIDSDFFSFEIADRTVLFYIGVLSAVFAVFRGMVPDDHLLYDPETAIRMVIQYTHFMPSEWKDKLHSDDVKKEFMKFYELRVMIFVHEILSIIFTPFILWYSLPDCSEKIVDFFREYTVHVDGIGYVCSSAVFDFKKNQNLTLPEDDEGDFMHNDKMMASYMGFIDNYGPKRTSKSDSRRTPYIPPAISDAQYDEMRPRSRGTGMGTGLAPPNPFGILQNRSNRAGMSASANLANSILLDNHHLPPPSRKEKHAKFKSSLHEEDEDDNGDYQPYGSKGKGKQKDGSGSDRSLSPDSKAVFDSELGESFMSTGLAQTVGPGDLGEGQAEDKNGVLDLIYQFQKTQGGQTVPL